jgi:hypothetical protein
MGQDGVAPASLRKVKRGASDLDAHAKSAHVQEFTRIAGQLLERPAQIRKWIMVSELKRHEPVTLKSGFSGRLPGCGAGEWPSKGLFPDKRSCAAIR